MSPTLRRQGLLIVGTLATAYVASHFFRAANVTIGLDLMRDLHIGPEALGALTGAFFFGFSAMQIPAGFLFDRYGPRRTICALLLLAVAGAAIFTLAPSWPVLLTGRTLMGAGFGCMLIGSMIVITRWFPPDWFSTLAGMVLSIGLVGNLVATTPLAWGTELIGWRGVFGIMVAFTAVALVAVWLVVRDAPPGHPFLDRKTETGAQMLRGLLEVVRSPNLPFILVLNFCNYACTFTVQGLWGGPFLREVHGLTIVESANVLLAAVVAYQVGMMCFSPLDRILDTRKWIAISGTLAIASILALFALLKAPPAWLVAGGIIAMGFVSASSTMVMTHGRALFPDRLIGRGMATMNTCVMLGVACMQTLSGVILGGFEKLPDGSRSELAYRSLFGFMAVVLVVAITVYSRAPDIRPSDELKARAAR
ncbi:MAG: MFS transporter [Reyranellaceae bacterium]